MAITSFSQWSATAASNVDLNSIPLSDSMLANQIDGAFQEMMAQLAAGVSPTSEGATTPTATSGSGAFGSVTCSLKWKRDGDRVSWVANVISSNKGTADGYVRIPLPVEAATEGGVDRYPVHGWHRDAGYALAGDVVTGTSYATVYGYNGSSPITAATNLVVGGEYYA